MTRPKKRESAPAPQLDLWSIPQTREAMGEVWCAQLQQLIPSAELQVVQDWTPDHLARTDRAALVQGWHLRIEWRDERATWLGWATKLPWSLASYQYNGRTSDPFYGGQAHPPGLDVWEFNLGVHRSEPNCPPTWLVTGQAQRILPRDALRDALARAIERRNEWHRNMMRHDAKYGEMGWW